MRDTKIFSCEETKNLNLNRNIVNVEYRKKKKEKERERKRYNKYNFLNQLVSIERVLFKICLCFVKVNKHNIRIKCLRFSVHIRLKRYKFPKSKIKTTHKRE